MTVNAHFDGKVIVPDEPLNLPANQALVVRIEQVASAGEPGTDSALTWLEANATDSPTQPVDLADQHDRYLYGVRSSETQR